MLAVALFAATTVMAWDRPAGLPHWDAGVRGGIPDVPIRLELSADDLETNPGATIQEAIDRVPTPGAVRLPVGTFQLHRPLEMRTGVVLRGAGVGRTRLEFEIPPLPPQSSGDIALAQGAIRFAGRRAATPIPWSDGYAKGTSVLHLADTSGLKAGDLILVFSENDPELMYTEERWNRDWARQSLAQIVSLTAVDGKTVTIDTPLRLDYRAELDPRIQLLEPIENAGVEGLSIIRLDHQADSVIGLEVAANCWVRDCESAWTGRGHIWMNFSRFLTIEGNEVHHAYDYGGGGNGYGIVAGNVAVDCLVVDNVLHHLRHAMMTKRGSNGNVFAYNYSFERRRDPPEKPLLCDISVHGHYSYANLFEGNVVAYIELADFWGPTGPGTTLFRNFVETRISINDHSHHTYVIGNQLGEGRIETDGTSRELVLIANQSHGDPIDESAPAWDTLPASLYYKTKPAFWSDLPWPPSPDLDTTEPRNPAEARGASHP